MFQQSLLLSSDLNRKPFSLGFSLFVQAAAVGLLSLLPLLYSPGLPALHIRTLLLMHPPVSTPVVTQPSVPVDRVPSVHRFVFNSAPVNRAVAVTRATATDAVAAPAFAFPDAGSNDSGTTGSILSLFDTPPRPAPTIQSKPSVKAPTAIRVGNGVAEANLIVKVQPSYPPLARSARVSGVVEFSATISKEGTIENLQLLRGHPLLVNAAKQAILQWRYRPTLLNGQPMEVLTSIVVTFTLNQ